MQKTIMNGATPLQVSGSPYKQFFIVYTVTSVFLLPFSDKSVWGGLARTARARTGGGSLTFLQVFEAGHMVPMDQPAAALEMLKAFTANKAFY